MVVPIRRHYGWDAVKGFSQAVVQHLAQTIPDRFVAKSGPRNRVGKIFVDYLRNGFGATTVSAWSARSRPGLGVSVPLEWDELPELKSASQWTVGNIGERIAHRQQAVGRDGEEPQGPGRGDEDAGLRAAAGLKPQTTSSVVTSKRCSVFTPNTIVIGTSAASRPRAITMRPMRGVLWRASKVCQRSPR